MTSRKETSEVAEFVDQDACNAPDVHGDRPLTVAVWRARSELCVYSWREARGRRRRRARPMGMEPHPYTTPVRVRMRTASIYY